MKTVYLISGLGADYRAFRFLELKNCEIIHIHWIQPEKGETIQAYATRLLLQIKNPAPILIGLSFGGMIAIEMGKLIRTRKIILISSAQTKDELPLYFRLAGWLRIDGLIPVRFLKKINPLVEWAFGVSNADEKSMLASFLEATSSSFMKWAIHVIVHWKNEIRLNNVVCIHGTNDRILPKTKAEYYVKDGGHLMILNKHREISHLINTLIHE